MKCKINNAVQLIRSQGEQILRGEEGKNARQHGKKTGKDIRILQPDRHGEISEKKRIGGRWRE